MDCNATTCSSHYNLNRFLELLYKEKNNSLQEHDIQKTVFAKFF